MPALSRQSLELRCQTVTIAERLVNDGAFSCEKHAFVHIYQKATRRKTKTGFDNPSLANAYECFKKFAQLHRGACCPQAALSSPDFPLFSPDDVFKYGV